MDLMLHSDPDAADMMTSTFNMRLVALVAVPLWAASSSMLDTSTRACASTLNSGNWHASPRELVAFLQLLSPASCDAWHVHACRESVEVNGSGG
jgi:hypothetical protein